MIQTLEAIVEADGSIRLIDDVKLMGPCRAFLMVLDEPPTNPGECALLAEAALAEDWMRPEEDAAWAHFQPAK